MNAALARPRARHRDTVRRAAVRPPPLSPGLELTRSALIIVFVLSGALVLQLVVVGGFQQRSAQQSLFDRLRGELAQGVAPTGPMTRSGRPLPVGTPMAYLEIPSIRLRQVVAEGTDAATLFAGPGHRRDSPFPGQLGGSVILGRRTAFGGPFSRLAELRSGERVQVTTGAGVFQFRVTGVRHDHDPAPNPLTSTEGRLVLITADGSPLAPSGVLRVDTELTVAGLAGDRPLFTAASLPLPERMMQLDSQTLWALVMWLQALLLVAVGGVWAWHRWHRAKAWVVFLPVLVLVFSFTSEQALRLLPNLF